VRIGSWTVDLFGARVSALVPLAVVVLIATALAYTMEVAAAARIGPRPASFLALTEVLFATLTAGLVLGQIPGPLQVAGGVVLLLGVVLVVSVPAPHRVAVEDEARPANPPGAHVVRRREAQRPARSRLPMRRASGPR
jgi:hypothetical protein